MRTCNRKFLIPSTMTNKKILPQGWSPMALKLSDKIEILSEAILPRKGTL